MEQTQHQQPDTVPTRRVLGAIYDRTMQALRGLPDVRETKPSPVRTYTPVREEPQSWLVQTMRHREKGDTVFVEYIDNEGSVRIALPPSVCEVIHRQREALTTMNRRAAARIRAANDKAAGKVPGFARKRKK